LGAYRIPLETGLLIPSVKFYKRGSQEENFSYRRIFSDSPAHVMKEGFVLA
jgi:hypothetical protein